MKIKFVVLFSVVVVALLWLQFGSPGPFNSSGETKPSLNGQALAQTYCYGCHVQPMPSDLDRQGWEKAFTWMSRFMGVYASETERDELLGKGDERQRLKAANIFPEQALISKEELEAIKRYYLQHAARTLPTKPTFMDTLTPFVVHQPDFQLDLPSATLVHFTPNGLTLGDANSQSLYYFNPNWNLERSVRLPDEGAVKITEVDGQELVLNLGSFSPTDAAIGNLVMFQNGQSRGILVKNLQRPVDFVLGNLNGGTENQHLVICEFGKWTGGLSLYENQGGTLKFVRYLDPRPGALNAHMVDLNDDGLNDVVALFGQAREGIYAYVNQGDLTFKTVPLVTFRPSHGSVHLALVDANADGLLDLLCTNGDNADVGNVPKPYHGVRLYENQGELQFTEKWFLPLQGAYKAFLEDYDGDGDRDVLALSFFPRFDQNPVQSLVYFSNEGNDSFDPHLVPVGHLGRWMVMDQGDPDGDGDLDIALGWLMFEVQENDTLMNHWLQRKLPLIWLENQTKTPLLDQESLSTVIE